VIVLFPELDQSTISEEQLIESIRAQVAASQGIPLEAVQVEIVESQASSNDVQQSPATTGVEATITVATDSLNSEQVTSLVDYFEGSDSNSFPQDFSQAYPQYGVPSATVPNPPQGNTDNNNNNDNSGSKDNDDDFPIWLIALIAVIGALLLIVLGAIVYLYNRRRRASQFKSAQGRDGSSVNIDASAVEGRHGSAAEMSGRPAVAL